MKFFKGAFFKGFRHGAEQFGMNIATLVNTAIALLIYLVGIGLTSIVAKIFRKGFLDFAMKKDTYWSELKLGKEDVQSYFRQF